MINVAGGNYYWYYYDGLGSVVALSDSTGKIAEKYDDDAFGNTMIYTPVYRNIFALPFKKLLANSCTHELGNSYGDSSTGISSPDTRLAIPKNEEKRPIL